MPLTRPKNPYLKSRRGRTATRTGVGLIVFLIAGFLLLRWYVDSSIETIVDHIGVQLYPHATLEYRSTHAALRGSVGLDGVKVRIRNIDEPINIEKLRINTKNLFELYKLVKSIEEKKRPDRFELSLLGIHVNADGALMKNWGQQTRISMFGSPLDVLGCEGIEIIGGKELQEMGYEKLLADARLSFEVEYPKLTHVLELNVDIKDIAVLALTARAGSAFFSPTKRQYSFTVPEIEKLTFVYEDRSYNERKNKFCAERAGTPVAEFIDRHVQAVRDYLLENGIRVGGELTDYYRQFLREAGRIQLDLNPTGAADITRVRWFDPREVVDWLGIRVVYNGKSIGLVDIASAASASKQEVAATVKDPRPTPDKIIPAGPVEVGLIPETYKDTSIADLSKYIDYQVIVFRRSGRQHHVWLDRVSEKTVTLKHYLVGGSASFSLDQADIERVQVLR